jgi:signal transduction histidine kinase
MQFLFFFGILCMIALASYAWIHYHQKNSRLEIAALRKIAEIQLQDACVQSVKEVKTQIGQDLHDEFSSSLAGIVHQLALLSRDPYTDDIPERLREIHEKAGEIYSSVRNRSHSLFSESDSANYFEENVYRIIDLLFPRGAYHFEVDMDQELINKLNLVQRIEVLRILQEAAANTLKHAKGATEVFIFLFEDEDQHVVFQYGDNGISKGHVTDGIGIQSIRKRVSKLGGELQVVHDGGLQLMVRFPLALGVMVAV